MSNLTDRLGGARASLAVKAPCRVATTANITLSGFQTINGITLADGDANLRVLVKNQTATAENGIYIASSGIWQRARDFDANGDVANGTRVIVGGGSQAGFYTLSCSEPVVIGTTALSFALASEVSAYYPITTLETAASVTPVDFGYPPGDVRRYGADPTDNSDSSTAWTNASRSGHHVYGGGPGCTYKITSSIPLTTSAMIDGGGCVIKPYGSGVGFVRVMGAAAATPTISSGATQGSRALVVSSVASLVVGQWVRIKDTHEVHPPSWARITAINGGTNTVSIDTALQHTYTALTGGSLSLEAYAAAAFLDHLRIENVVFDGSDSTSSSIGAAVDPQGFLLCELERCTFQNWSDSTSSDAYPVAVNYCIDVVINGNRSIDQDNGTGMPACMLVWHARTCRYSHNEHAGHGFGPQAIRCDVAIFNGNTLSGLLQQENDAGYQASIRGIKAAYNGRVTYTGNVITGYESAIKNDDNFVSVITGNTVAGAVGMADTGQIIINSSHEAQSAVTGNGAHTGPIRVTSNIVISNNSIDGCPSTAIGITSAATSGTITISPTIKGNRIRKPGRYAIFINHDTNAIRAIKPVITGNDISDWGQITSGAAIQHADHGGIIVANQFRNDGATSLDCISGFGTGYPWQVSKNVSHSGNPIRQEEGTHTLASAATVFVGIYPQRNVVVTGTTTISSFGGGVTGVERVLRFTGALTITHNATTLISPTGANLTIAAGDVIVMQLETAGWRILEHHRTNALGTLTLANGANNDVALPGNRNLIISGPTLAFSVSGFAGGVDGERRTIINPTAQNMTVTNDATSTAANRILTQTGADVTHTGRSSIEILYVGSESRWLMVGGQA